MKFKESTESFFAWLARPMVFKCGLINVPEGDESGPCYKGRLAQDAIKDVSMQFFAAVKSIENDSRLTTEGKLSEIQKEGKAALAKISKLYPQTLKQIESEFHTIRNAFLNPKKEEETPGQVLREIDTRNLLMKLDETKRFQILQEALASKNELIINSFLNAPAFVGILNQDIINTTKTKWAKIQQPELAAKFDEISSVLQKASISFSDSIAAISDMSDQQNEEQLYKYQKLSGELMRGDMLSYKPGDIIPEEK